MHQRWILFVLLLDADPRDPGCDAARAVVHVYVDELRAGIDAPTRNPGAADHFVACDACRQVLQGLVATAATHDRASHDP
ncbi:hypothetical protein [Cellulosimicrobium sp. CpK407]|uniref:hypothetical protein n=1 Tax=Cellulosimicrobium sp. CpK407 TaxID=3229847 RepID=UPI003F33F2B6